MKINNPKIINYEENDVMDSYFNDMFKNSLYKNNVAKEIIIKDTTFDSCIFEKIDFTNIILLNVDLIDVIFDGCDLSNQCFDKKLIGRVIFKNCKMIGTTFIESSLKDVQIEDCICNYINLSCKINTIIIKNSNLSDAIFIEGNIKNMELENVSFTGAEFNKTSLKDIDFSSCNIDNCIFDFYSLKGIIINQFQCPNLIGMLGVQIKD